MNRIGKMEIRLQEKILLRKKLDYQETYFIKKKYKLFFDSKRNNF